MRKNILILLILTAVLTGCDKNKEANVNYKPVAAFKIIGYDSKIPRIEQGEAVVLQDESFDIDGKVVEWHYDFGDGTTSDEQNPSHVYNVLGKYTISLTTRDDNGLSSANIYTRDVQVVEPSFADEEPSILWSFDIPYATKWNKSGITLADDGTAYVGVDGDGSADNIYAIDKNGNKLWSYKTPSGHIYGSMPLTRDNKVLYGIEKSGYVFALNTTDGSVIWQNQITTAVSYGGTVLSNDEKTIYVGCYTGDNDIKAVNTSDGTVQWEIDTPNGIRTTAVIDTNGNIYIADLYRRLYAIAPDGTLLWSVTDRIARTANPIAMDESRGVLYIGTAGNHFYAINLADGTTKWENTEIEGVYLNGAAIGNDGTVYITSESDKMIRALDPENGNTLWEYECKGAVKAVPTIDTKGNLYFGDLSGYFYILNKNGQDAWKTVRLSGEIWSSCALSDEGTIYVLAYDDLAGGNKLYALKSDGTPIAKSIWPTRSNNNKRSGQSTNNE
jgi:outer membrane protein assembly factor BamB